MAQETPLPGIMAFSRSPGQWFSDGHFTERQVTVLEQAEKRGYLYDPHVTATEFTLCGGQFVLGRWRTLRNQAMLFGFERESLIQSVCQGDPVALLACADLLEECGDVDDAGPLRTLPAMAEQIRAAIEGLPAAGGERGLVVYLKPNGWSISRVGRGKPLLAREVEIAELLLSNWRGFHIGQWLTSRLDQNSGRLTVLQGKTVLGCDVSTEHYERACQEIQECGWPDTPEMRLASTVQMHLAEQVPTPYKEGTRQ